MPKPSTFPTLYDECKTVSISFLTEHGYLKPDQWKTGTITWSRGEGEHKRITGSINIAVITDRQNPYFELNYKTNDKPINYQVQLVSIPSNIGKGVVWFFICPNTGIRCRKLYLISGYFLHRNAFKGCFYEKQTYSHNNRQLNKSFEIFFGGDHAYEKIYSKHFKKTYAGKTTKKYAKLYKKIKEAETVSPKQILKHKYLR